MQRGAYDYLTKPFDHDEVLLLAERALSARALAQEVVRAPDGDPGGVGVRRAGRQVAPDAGGLQDHRAHRRDRRDRPPAGRVGHGQGGRGARHPPLQPASGQAVRGRLLRGDPGHPPRVRAVRPRARGVHRRAPAPARPASSSRTAARSSSTRSATCRRSCRRSCCAPSRSASSSASAAARRSPSTSASSPRRTATSRRSSGTDASARTSTTASTSSRSRCRRSASASRTSRSWSSTSSGSTATELGERAIAPEALDRLMGYDWPGNVRELENVIQHAMVMAGGGVDPARAPADRARARPAAGGRREPSSSSSSRSSPSACTASAGASRRTSTIS